MEPTTQNPNQSNNQTDATPSKERPAETMFPPRLSNHLIITPLTNQLVAHIARIQVVNKTQNFQIMAKEPYS